MSSSWAKIDGHLAIEYSEGIYFPSAEELLCACGGNASVLNSIVSDAGNPVNTFPALRYSSIGASINCILENRDEDSISLSLFCQKRGSVFHLSLFNGRIIDQCIYDDTWFVVNGDLSELEGRLYRAGINDTGIISIKQYIKLTEIETFSQKKLFKNLVQFEKLKSPSPSSIESPPTLLATLFEYQKVGYAWISQMLQETGGCILGDEMGLGKTMQVIATALFMKQQGKLPILVVAPVSLLANWNRELGKFAPSLNVHIHHGPNRIGNFRDFFHYDVIVTAYSTVVNDIHMMRMVKWSFVALDEAQNIKNPYSARTKACKMLDRDGSIAVTGTPFENHMSDIWSLVDFVLPGLLGSLPSYNENITDDVYGGEKIEPILSPIMIRRLVSEVAKDLPEKVVIAQPIMMSEEESDQYAEYLESIVSSYDGTSINLGMLTKLRMFCTHPLITQETAAYVDPCHNSVKYQRFCEIMDEIINAGEKVIIFTSYKKMFDIFSYDLERRYHIYVNTINGDTPVDMRQAIVDEFNSLQAPAALILNPRAAGTGLNITGANHVIHYNLEWNPSLEDQSSARSYRRGQDKTVFVYRLYYENTVEQVVNERIERKRDTASAAVVGNTGEHVDREDIIRALQLIPTIRTK